MKTAIIMTHWERQEFFKEIIKNLNEQSIKNFDVFIWNNNNNKSRIRHLENCKKINKDYRLYIRHYHKNIYGFGRFVMAKHLLENKIKDYNGNDYDKIIFFDDDQRVTPDFVKFMEENYEEKSYIGYWSFVTNKNYRDRRKCKKGETADYVGTGGSIIDPSVFRDYDFFETFPGKKFYWIEDICLTLYCKKIGWKTSSLGLNKKNDYIINIKDKKSLFRKMGGHNSKIKNYEKLKKYYEIN